MNMILKAKLTMPQFLSAEAQALLRFGPKRKNIKKQKKIQIYFSETFSNETQKIVLAVAWMVQKN